MKYYHFFLAVAAGMMMPTQGAINNRLAGFVDSPILASFVSFLVGTIALFIYLLASGTPLNPLLQSKNVPLIAWTGGLLGAFFVTTTTFLVPRIGVALTFSLFILGQMLITIVIDHFGFMGVPVKSVNMMRVLGVSLIVLGVILVRNN
jgi:bacterial/archaeal transporter family-2 protein